MESKALVKSTNINVACRFFARTPSRILRMVNICEVVDLFLRKPTSGSKIPIFTGKASEFQALVEAFRKRLEFTSLHRQSW